MLCYVLRTSDISTHTNTAKQAQFCNIYILENVRKRRGCFEGTGYIYNIEKRTSSEKRWFSCMTRHLTPSISPTAHNDSDQWPTTSTINTTLLYPQRASLPLSSPYRAWSISFSCCRREHGISSHFSLADCVCVPGGICRSTRYAVSNLTSSTQLKQLAILAGPSTPARLPTGPRCRS